MNWRSSQFGPRLPISDSPQTLLGTASDRLDHDAEVTRQAAATAATKGYSEQIVTSARQAAENYAELVAAMQTADATNDVTERMALICGQTSALRDLAVYEEDD
jgi:hypothetical protein